MKVENVSQMQIYVIDLNHSMTVTHSPNKVSRIIHCKHITVQHFQNALAYLAMAVSYEHSTDVSYERKVFRKPTPGVNVIKLFSLLLTLL
jgi:hypothetical protein